jgi:hypothetical protein
MRFSECIIADVTTLNFNLLFEIGFALGLEQAVVPIRDTTIMTDEEQFRELGLLDTVGYVDFQNSDSLAEALIARLPVAPMRSPRVALNRESPLYVLKGHIQTEGDVLLLSTLKKSAIRFRTYDVVETPRLSLHEARKQVEASLALVAHLLSPSRQGAIIHNARCALLAGIAMASGKAVLLVQEGAARQPIDYRDVVVPYTKPDQLPRLLEPFIRQVISRLQDTSSHTASMPVRFLERLDLGDVAAENEILALRSYFVRTAQFNEAKRGTARLVTGRKGSGKSAIFYAVRDSIPRGHSYLVLDLKPEGHQFTKLREVVLDKLSPGLQEHTLTAFWNYILLCEMAQKIRDYDYTWAQRDEERRARFEELLAVYGEQVPADIGDFSERLLRQVDRLTERFSESEDDRGALTGGVLTETLFRGDIRVLDDVLAPYLREKDAVWVLVDNLDKGWPTRGSRSADILILRALLEATRKLQRQFEQRGVEFHSLVFLRNDIHEHLVRETPDRGKETAISVDWDDPEVFKEIFRQRMKVSTGSDEKFEDVWPRIFEAHIGARDSFGYMVERTLMRPRDLLTFLHRAIGVAVNRGHDHVSKDDVLKAEETCSEDILLNTAWELRDVYPEMINLLYMFHKCSTHLTKEQALAFIGEAGGHNNTAEEILELLVWFGFLGVQEAGEHEPTFAYQVRYNVEKLMAPVDRGKAVLVVNPAFYRALSCTEAH